MKHFLIIPLLVSLFVIGCANKNQASEQSEKTKDLQTENTVSKNENKPVEKIDLMPITSKEPTKSELVSEQSKPVKPNPIKEKAMLDVPLIKQNPELKYGCEVTSLAMVLQFAGVKVNKIQLANQLEKDVDPVVRDKNGNIIKWGNPDDGFVGDMTGKHMGYAVFDKPLERLMAKYLSTRVVNLTNQPFEKLLSQVSKGKPVLVWTTGDYRLPDRWESWKHGNRIIKTPLDLHAVVLVGYDKEYVYVNDPLSGRKNAKINKTTFIQSWVALKKRALSYI